MQTEQFLETLERLANRGEQVRLVADEEYTDAYIAYRREVDIFHHLVASSPHSWADHIGRLSCHRKRPCRSP